jgi:hypothetical protein
MFFPIEHPTLPHKSFFRSPALIRFPRFNRLQTWPGVVPFLYPQFGSGQPRCGVGLSALYAETHCEASCRIRIVSSPV